MKWVLLFGMWTALCSVGFAEKERVYGPEFTFTNPRMMVSLTVDKDFKNAGNYTETNYIEKKKEQFAEYIQKNCKHCGWEWVWSSRKGTYIFRVHLDDTFYFDITPDPMVIEVTAKPSTVETFKHYRQQMQRWVFDAAADLNMYPSNLVGGGHISVGASAFKGRPLLFRNFIVDLVNNPEIADHQRGPALTMADSSRKRQEAFRKAIDDFDAGKLNHIRTLAKRIRDEAYPEETVRYVAVALSYLSANPVEEPIAPSARRVELRGFPAQKTYTEFLHQIEIIDSRLVHLGKKRSGIPVQIPGPRSRSQRVERFKAWLRETGLDWNRYRDLPILPPWYMQLDPRVLCTKAMRAIGG